MVYPIHVAICWKKPKLILAGCRQHMGLLWIAVAGLFIYILDCRYRFPKLKMFEFAAISSPTISSPIISSTTISSHFETACRSLDQLKIRHPKFFRVSSLQLEKSRVSYLQLNNLWCLIFNWSGFPKLGCQYICYNLRA